MRPRGEARPANRAREERGDDRCGDAAAVRTMRPGCVRHSRKTRRAQQPRGAFGRLGDFCSTSEPRRRGGGDEVRVSFAIRSANDRDRHRPPPRCALRRGRCRSSRDRGHDDDAIARERGDDPRDALESGRRGDRRPAELQDGPGQRMVRAMAITSPSIAEAVASPPAPGPPKTRVPAMSVSRRTTFVGPLAAPSSESRATSSGPTRAFVAFSPKSAVAR